METKVCSSCGLAKPLGCFPRRRKSPDGLSYGCQECNSAKAKQWRQKNKERCRVKGQYYYQQNKATITERNKQYKSLHREHFLAYQSRWRVKNSAKLKHQKKEWYDQNKEAVAVYKQRYNRENRERISLRRTAYMTDPRRRLHHAMSTNLRLSIRGLKAGRRWERILGYTLNDLMGHLERHFQPGMNWENYGFGSGKWHIDHCIPKSKFTIKSINDQAFRECWALSNLQPLWQVENCSKSNRFCHPQLNNESDL